MEGAAESREGTQREEAQHHRPMERVYEAHEEDEVDPLHANPTMQVALTDVEVDIVDARQASEERNELRRRGTIEARFRRMMTRSQRPSMAGQQLEIWRMEIAQRVEVLSIQAAHQKEIKRREMVQQEEIRRVLNTQEEENWSMDPAKLQRMKMIQGEEIRTLRIDQREEIRRVEMFHRDEVRRIQMFQREEIQGLRMMQLGRHLSQLALYYGSSRGAPPAARTAVDNLPVISIEQEQLEDGSAMICSICLEILPCGQPVKMLPCLHFYHEYCILMWLESKNSCPICRHELP